MSETVYISGPMTGYADFNRQAFHVAERRLRNMGFEQIINPAGLDEIMPAPEHLVDGTPESHAWYMRRDIEALVGCDAIYMLPGWRWSKGANLEHKIAEAIGLREIVDPNPKAWACLEGEPLDEGHRKARECEGATFGGHPRFDCQAEPVFAPDEVGYIVDDSLPRDTLRFEFGGLSVDYRVSWGDDGSMRLHPKTPLDTAHNQGVRA